MLTEKGTMKTEVIFSDDRSSRYLLHREWDSKKKSAMIIMTNPSTADLHSLDYTTLYIINNLVKLDFGSVDIVNLVSTCSTKLSLKDVSNTLEDENVKVISASAEKADHIIIAWGSNGENSIKIKSLQQALLKHLQPYSKKIFTIGDSLGRTGFHPLAPQIRFAWQLAPYKYQKEKLHKN